MTKALFKKQMMEAFSWIFFNRKNGEKRTKAGVFAYGLLYLFVFGMLGFVFYTMSEVLCEPLCEMGFGWLYFVLISFIAIVLGVLGSVFNTFSVLYQAKDNDLLLSMPIPASKILLMRLSGIYMMGLMYEMIVMIPALIVWFIFGSVTFWGIVFSILIPFVLSFLILTLSCILGWAVALVIGRVKNKSFITVALSLVFLFGYYYVYAKAYTILTNLIANAENIADGVKNILYPFYHMGRAAEGRAFSMLIFTGIIAVLFGIVYMVLSRSFIKLATTNRGAVKVRYKEKAVKAGNADSALFRKEFKRFTSSAGYMLNCSLGTLFMLAGSVMLIWKGKVLIEILPFLYEELNEMLPLLVAAALCMVSSMNDITAPSVSLEGKNIWLVQVLPVTPWQVLKVKLKLHLILTIIPVAVLTVSALIIFKPMAVYMFFIPLTVAAFIFTIALFGLIMNLKVPNLNWTNEIVPIKQSMSVTVTLFGGWGLVFGFGALYYAVRNVISPIIYLICVCVFLLMLSLFMYIWIKNKGTKIFASLS